MRRFSLTMLLATFLGLGFAAGAGASLFGTNCFKPDRMLLPRHLCLNLPP
jgi:hypothetical protein